MVFSSFALFRSIRIVGSSSNYCNFGKWSARSGASCFNRRDFSTGTASEAVRNQHSPPWLMLPPESEGGTTSYKFYGLADNKVQTRSPSDVIGNLRLTCRGSSHGWLALLSQHDDGFFLYNPITRRHIKLPSILNLPTLPYVNILSSATYVKKVILSCSPDEDEENCRVVVMRACGNPLAFCCPGRSKDWTLMLDENRDDKRFYRDCVFSTTRQNLFFGLTSHIELEIWDLGDPSSPKLIKYDDVEMENYDCLSSLERSAKILLGRVEHLLLVKEDLLMVFQKVMEWVGPDGSCVNQYTPNKYRYMTIGFDIWKYYPEEGKFKYLDSSSLGGLAIFVGLLSHSVAIQASDFPDVKPGSVYFTDGYCTGTLGGDDDDVLCRGGHDIGIFNFQNKTVSPCYYPCDLPSLKNILPAPIWFFPSLTN
ncbi:hypothetical protein CASFOL_026662 [Castilleja foliolosa]|uniref:KIB1-4 beta-propeller domain-containing protein n=1 Tax=Castilleja foliolosa TaxID=1961234 RepID=A0ABD3CL12_9LAMI